MSVGEEILSIAAREIGYHERDGKRNKYGAWYGMDGVAWCMIFVQWVYDQAGVPLPYKTASCGALLRWYKTNQPECVTDKPVPGCIVIFDFPGGAATDHTGLYVSRNSTDTVTTIDGNTSGLNQANGGWVQQKTRSRSYAKPVYIVPRELRETKKNDEEDDTVRRFQTIEEIKRDAPWAEETVQKLVNRGVIKGSGGNLDLSEDMLRVLVFQDRAGAYDVNLKKLFAVMREQDGEA